MHLRLIHAIAALATLTLATPSSATVVWQFEGTVRTQDDTTTFNPELSALGIGVGTPISGYFEMNEWAADTQPADPTRGFYTNAMTGGQLSVGDTTITISNGVSPNFVLVDTDVVWDDYTVGSISGAGGGTSTDLDIGFAFFELVADDLSIITSEVFPTTPPSLSDLTTFDDLLLEPLKTSFGFSLLSGGGGLVRAEITSLSAIPEPSTGLLVSIGLLGLARATRRR